MQWLSNNQMKANPDKCQLSTSSNKESGICFDNNIINNKCGKLPGVKIDQKLNFNAHINDICKKSGQKLNAFSKITFYINIPRRRFFAKCLIYVSFQLLSFLWKCHRPSENYQNKLPS